MSEDRGRTRSHFRVSLRRPSPIEQRSRIVPASHPRDEGQQEPPEAELDEGIRRVAENDEAPSRAAAPRDRRRQTRIDDSMIHAAPRLALGALHEEGSMQMRALMGRGAVFTGIALALVAGGVSCSSKSPPTASQHAPLTIRSFDFESAMDGGGGDASCSCTGTDLNGNSVTTTTCGQVVCGLDDQTWVCGSSGFEYQGNSCAGGDASSGCSCSGTDINGNSVTTNTCGQTVCGLDNQNWACTTSGFQNQGTACGSDAGSGSGCSCYGTDNNGNSVYTSVCGQTVCGLDEQTWACTSTGFQNQGTSCCNCTGTDVNGNQVSTTTCGQTVCGLDDETWVCTSSGFQLQGGACTDGGTGSDSGCSCTGTDNNGNSVYTTVCGQTVCGQDEQTWACTSTGFQNQGTACTGGDGG